LAKRLSLARQLRGVRGFSLVHGAVPELLIRSAERAERVQLARELRGAHLSTPKVAWRGADMLFVVAAAISGLSLHLLLRYV
jgi:energy-coupling factor transporter transmembrane protein EcfT